MRVYASLGALASIAWLSSAAAVPRAEDWGALTDTTCTTTTPDQATVIVLPGQSAASYTAPTVFTFTLPANGGPDSPGGSPATLSGSLGSSSDLANGPSIVSSTRTSLETPLAPGDSAGLSGLVTVTVPFPSLPTPSAPAVSTVTVPVLTVTLPSPAISPDSSIVTVTVQPDTSGPGSEATATPVVTETVPGVGASNSVGVITVTIPEGPSDTATVVVTVTVPQGSDSPGAWSTIITAPGISGAPTGPLVTVTIFTSPVPAASAGPSTPPLDWSSESTDFITVPLDTGYGSNSLLAPYTLTYTLPVAPDLTDMSVATITVTPVDLSIPTGLGPFATATLSSGVSSWSYVPSPPGTSVVSFTVSASGTVPGYTGVITVTPGMSWGAPTPVITGQPGLVTITAPEVTVTVPLSPGSVGESSGVVTVTVVSPTDSIVLPTTSSPGDQPGVVTITVPSVPSSAQPPPASIVTVTVPQGSGSGPSVFTLTIPQPTASAIPSPDVGYSGSVGTEPVPVITVTAVDTTVVATPDFGFPFGTATTQPSVVTVTNTPSSPPNTGAGAQTPSIVAVTYTAPASLGVPASEYTVTYTLTPGDAQSPDTVSVPSGVTTVTYTPSSTGVVTVTETPAGAFNTGSGGGVFTVTPPSGAPFVVTIPSSVTQDASSTTGSGVNVITIPEGGYGGSGRPSTLGASAAVLTVTAPQTVIVSQVTISETISLGPGSSTVVAITTQVTLPAGSTPTSSSSTSPAILVTPSPVTYTLADSYGNPTTLTSWTYLPVSPSASDLGTAQFITISPSNYASVITIIPSAAPSIITIWPSANTLLTSFLTSTSCTAEDPGATDSVDPDQAQSDSASPSEITLWPLPTSIDTTCTTFSTSYRSPLISDPGAATSASPFSVITLWPSTSSPPYSVVTIWPSSDDSALAGWPTTSTCTETPAISTSVILLSSVSTPFTTFPTPSASQGGESSILIVPTETAEAPVSQGLDTSAGALPESTELTPSQPENTESPASQPENTEGPLAQPENTEAPVSASDDLIPPPQTEFNRHGEHARTTVVALSDNTFGGYAFSSSAAGYGNLPPGYGNPVATAPAFSSEPIFFTDSNLPVSQPAPVTIPDASITSSILPVVTTSSADLASLLSSIMSVLSANATLVSGPGPVLTSIPAASSNKTPSAVPSLTSTTAVLSSSDLLLPSDSLVPTLTALPTTASSLLVNLSSLTAAPVATSLASPSLNATATGTLSSNQTALSFITSVSVASSSAPGVTLSSSVPENVTLSSTSSRGLPASTCGAVGDRGAVIFKFDDIPTISTDNDTEASSFPAMPVPFPYHRFFFSNGFTVVPPPRTKFKPSSGEQLIQHNSSVSPVAEFGLAQLRSNPCFHFRFLGVSLGCDSTTDPCVFNITGLRWNGTEDIVEARHTFEVAACPKKTDCSLSHQILDSAAELPFSNLTSLNISLTVAGKPETWWADDLQIAWADNDCTAAACRSRVPNTIMIPHKAQTFSNRAKRLLRWAARGNDDERH